MAKLTKAQAKAHAEACAILAKPGELTDNEKEFVARNWNEAANNLNTIAGAHFTPFDLAMDFAFDVGGHRILDLCAGIGLLGLAAVFRREIKEEGLTCIEINPDYIAVGKRLLPKATWIQADAFDLPKLNLGHFDNIISNPPFGRSAVKTGSGPRYTGPDFDLTLLDLAADHADFLTFLLPQSNSPFLYSGQRYYQRNTSGKGFDFEQQTGFHLVAGAGVDTVLYRDQWKTVSVTCEIVCFDVLAWREEQAEKAAKAPPPVVQAEPVKLADGPAQQILVPGIAPVSPLQAQFRAYEAKRAKKRGAAPLPAGGLFDTTSINQLSLI